jgi:hypothetical protein
MMKSIPFFLGCLFAFSSVFSQNSEPTHGEFPANTAWFNCEMQLTIENLKDKVVVVEIWHPDNLEGRWIAQTIQEKAALHQQIQMVSLIVGDTLHPFSRNDINAFIQENGIIHPVGLVKDLKSFPDLKVDQLPILMLFQQSVNPILVSNDGSSIKEIVQMVDEISKDQQYLFSLSAWQAGPSIDPRYWADPLVEYPTYISSTDGFFPLFITENAHQRFIVLNGEGVAEFNVGSYPGYLDGNFLSSRFRNAGGTSYDSENKLLYIADTDNNRVRVADLGSRIVYNLIGNGEQSTGQAHFIDGPMQAMGFPTDVLYKSGKLYVLSGQSSQLFEADPLSGKCTELAHFPRVPLRDGLYSTYPKNLSESKDGLYVTMSDGKVYHVKGKKVDVFYSPEMGKGKASAVSYFGKNTFVAMSDSNRVYMVDKKAKWSLLAGSGAKGSANGVKEEATFNGISDLTMANGELIACDKRNSLLRMINPKTGKTRTLQFKPEMELVYNVDAINGGEPVLFDSLFVARGENELTITFDLQGYEIVKGRNEVFVNETENGPKLESNEVTEKGIRCTFDTAKLPSDLLQFEVYMTLSPKAEPDKILIKRAFFNVMLEKTSTAGRDHTIVYYPNLLPY